MLRFILGRAATGKSSRIIELLAQSVERGERPLLLVPEQFSFESERTVLASLGDGASQNVSVVSFTRLCDEIERLFGGSAGRNLTDSDKAVLMSRALRNAAPELTVWQGYSRSAGFAGRMLETINEFKISAVFPEDIERAAEFAGGTLGMKLCDTACIFKHYNALVTERFLDPSDRLDRLYHNLADNCFFEGREVFIDSFKGFTGQQFRILDRIIAQASGVTVSLVYNTKGSESTGIFDNIGKLKHRLEGMAASHGVGCAPSILLEKNYYKNDMLTAAEELMAIGRVQAPCLKEGITLCRAESIFDEAEFAARNIRRIVRTKQAVYDDFVIIARDTSPYEEALASACLRNGIRCFIDRRIPLSALPPAATVLSAIQAARSFTTENILRFNKSGIELLDSDELSTLENYTYLWNIRGAMWNESWDMNPAGFESGVSDSAEEELSKINALRQRAVGPLITFRKSFCGTPGDMAKALVNLFEECGAAESFALLADTYRADGKADVADAVSRAYDVIMQLLDSMVLCLGEGECDVHTFCDSLKTAISLTTVGVAPQMLDEVVFGAADRIRPSRPKYAFILGANQGVFPRAVSASGLFGGRDRERLIELGIDIPDRSEESAVDEEFLVYSNVCCPTEGLFISYLSSSSDGASAEPSAFVTRLKEQLDCGTVYEPDRLSADNLPETEQSAIFEFSRRMPLSPEDAWTVAASLKNNKSASLKLEHIVQSSERRKMAISRQASGELFGKDIYMSPSRFDNFNRCRFMYFCRDGLKASRLQPADFDAMQRGTLIHYVLQRVIEKYGKAVSELKAEQIFSAVDQYTDEYLDSIPGYRHVETARSRFLVSTMRRSLKYIVERLSLEFAQSDFNPVKCELRIGEGGDMPPLEIPLDEHSRLRLTGIIDRVDSWNGYIRIVDYKTGHRDFKLPDILFGQNMQMLIYLYALLKGPASENLAAGIFYMPARRARGSTAADRRMSGIMVADSELVHAMEKENRGEFVPRLTDNLSDSFISSEDFEEIFGYIERKLKSVGKSILSGDIAVDPVDGIDSPACKYCDFSAVCRIEDSVRKCVPKMNNASVLELLKKEEPYEL